jgi:hypothetical protein
MPPGTAGARRCPAQDLTQWGQLTHASGAPTLCVAEPSVATLWFVTGGCVLTLFQKMTPQALCYLEHWPFTFVMPDTQMCASGCPLGRGAGLGIQETELDLEKAELAPRKWPPESCE